MWSFTGSDKQLWKWSESGNQLINVATGKPLAVGGFTEWRVTSRFFFLARMTLDPPTSK